MEAILITTLVCVTFIILAIIGKKKKITRCSMGNKIFNGYVEEKDDIEVNKETGEITPENGTDNPSGYYPTCRFCGRQFLPLANYESQAVADEAATIRCDCFDARQYQDE